MLCVFFSNGKKKKNKVLFDFAFFSRLHTEERVRFVPIVPFSMYEQAARRVLYSHVIPVEVAGSKSSSNKSQSRMSAFEHVETAPPDPILGITTAFKVNGFRIFVCLFGERVTYCYL